MNMPEDEHLFSSPNMRRALIVDLLLHQGEQTVEQLAERFGVSGMTIRRDLQDLETAGKLMRTWGGAAPTDRVAFEFRFLERAGHEREAKQAIAATAATLVKPGQHVLLDSSTTTLAIARQLRQFDQLTVITTSLPIASELFGREGIEVILLGGVLRKDEPDLTGAITEHALGLLHAEVAFIGADGIDAEGSIYTSAPEVARMLQKMAATADHVYAVADHTKLDRRALMRFAQLNDFTGLITDSQADAQFINGLEQAGAKVLLPKATQLVEQ